MLLHIADLELHDLDPYYLHDISATFCKNALILLIIAGSELSTIQQLIAAYPYYLHDISATCSKNTSDTHTF